MRTGTIENFGKLAGGPLLADALERPDLIRAVNGKIIGPRPPNLRGDHPHKANIAAQPDHLVVDGKPLLRAEARDVLDRLIDMGPLRTTHGAHVRS
jgi:hypothetical protein